MKNSLLLFMSSMDTSLFIESLAYTIAYNRNVAAY